MSAATAVPDTRSLLADADLCVKCGLCLPHCPTYLDTQHEGDSPRGRITLIQGLSTGLIQSTPRFEAHLDGCLSCRRCEVVCPARVPFSRILDGGRAQLADLRPERTRVSRLLALVLVSSAWRGLLRVALAMYRALGVQNLVRRFRLLGGGSLARLESLIPREPKDRNIAAVPVATEAEPIAILRGCASEVFERDALHATEVLLNAAGFKVQPVVDQTCCGALHQHAGMPEAARRLVRQNIKVFSTHERIASITTGCAATLRDYGDFGVDGGAAFADRVKDFADWLLPRMDRLRFRPLPLRAALHTPCTALNVMKSDIALRALLARIPQLELVELDPTQRCCGAAGSHFITHAAQSDRLLQPKLDAIARIRPDFIISSNIGCSLHLLGGITRATSMAVPPAPRPPVRHPAVVLAEQLDRSPPRS
ncbi:MAG: (Fe-S)-binding protein [Panacagrimonas sp.]